MYEKIGVGVKWFINLSITFIGGLYGEVSVSLKVLLIMMTLDMFLGWRVAKRGLSVKTENGGFKNDVLKHGLDKKVVTFLLVMVGYLMDKLIGINFVGEAFVWFYIANELTSISENATILGVIKVPIINKIVDFLIEMSNKDVK